MTDQYTIDELADALNTAQADAEAAQERAQFGKLTIKPRFIQWVDHEPVDITGAAYAKLDQRARTLELIFGVDIQEFKPELEFTYERKVAVGSTDWWKICRPSIEAVLGKGALGKDKMNATLNALQGKYVEVHDVMQSATKKKPDPEFRTIQLVKIFETREACFAAHQVRFSAVEGAAPAADTVAAAVNLPAGWEADAWSAVAEDFKAAITDLKAKPEAVQGKLAEKVAKDYAVPPEFVAAALAA
jgi:hypothetical protein